MIVGNLIVESAAEIQARLDAMPLPRRWGNWVFDAETLVLQNEHPRAGGYWIDLEKIDTSAQMLDWIFQIAGKCKPGKFWDSVYDPRGLVEALKAVLKPQAYYCGSGKSKRASGRKLAKEYAARLREQWS